MKIAIIGAGASGIFCAGKIFSSHQVTIFEKMPNPAIKLSITGNSRCNVTNLKTPAQFLQNVPVGSKFLQSAIYSFSPQNMFDELEKSGIELIEENDNKIYPATGKSRTIINHLLDKHKENVSIKTNCQVLEIYKDENNFVITTNNSKETFDAVIIATGGKSYPRTGSQGDGYDFAKKFGHSVSPLRQSLCGFLTDTSLSLPCSGVSFEANVSLVNSHGKILCSNTGSYIFTHFGISGPGAHILSSKCKETSINDCHLEIDFAPLVHKEHLYENLLGQISQNPKQESFFFLKQFFASRIAQEFLNQNQQFAKAKLGNLNKQQRQDLINLIKSHKIKVHDFDSFDRSVVTRGGVDTNEINPKTMESKIVKNLFFLGEVLNVDGFTGGFNLQIAFSTANSCAMHINSI